MLINIIRQKILLALMLYACYHSPAIAQDKREFFFQKLTTLNGLSSNFIQCIYRDSRGYVWVGTTYGLNRYDGKNIKVYHHDPRDPHSLPRESVRRIVEDKNGNLWMGADYGLMEFNPLTEQFNLYRHKSGNPESLSGDHVPSPFIDSGNHIWVSTEHGLQLFDREHRTFKTFLPSYRDSIRKIPLSGGLWNLAEDKQNNIWCNGSRELFRFEASTQELVLIPCRYKQSIEISGIFFDHDSNFWVVDWKGGLKLFHPETGQYEPIPNIIFDRDNQCGKICEWRDPSGVYWLTVCTYRGLLLYNHRSKTNILIQNNPSNPSSLIDNFTTCVYADRDNILWIGTQNGLNILDIADQAFHSRNPVQGNFKEDKGLPGAVETIYEEKDLKIISFWWTKGMSIYDKDWNPIRFYRGIPPSDTSLEARDIIGIYKDYRGIYWIATDNSLIRFDRTKNSFKAFIPPGIHDEPAQVPRLLREIVPADSVNFYIRSKSFGIYKFDIEKEQFVQHLYHRDKDPASLPSNDLRAIVKGDKNKLIIISVNDGIFIYNPLNNSYETYNHHPDISINEALHNLYYDPGLSGNILWLNSAHGLLKMNLLTGKLEVFNSRNGLANDFLVSNEVDANGNVWVAHNAGISKFDTTTHTFTNYDENKGLVFKEFNHNMKKMADGNIYIGDQVRLIYFDPGQFRINQNIPQVHINSVQVLNEPFKITIDQVTRKKTLVLNYDQDLITVDFSVLNLSHPKENIFFYRLDKDTVWHKLNEGFVNLVRLSPGHYVLHVTGSNDSGVMNTKGDTLYITVLPPYYQTWWFRLLIIAAIVLILFRILRFRINRIRHEEQLKTEFNKQLAQAETKALRAQMNPHFIFNSLNSINSFVMDKKHEMASDYLIKFSKLIRLILDNSRSETISLEKELETLKLYIILEAARFDNKFKCIYRIAEDVNPGSVMIPPMLLQPFVENAIWHGLMQKEGEGTIIVEINKENEEFLNISITDDGIGREKAAELKSKSATHKSHGLKVTTQRIEMMNRLNTTGARVHVIDLKDEQGNATGTRVELVIPF